MVLDVLYYVKYSQTFWRNVFSVCSLLFMASTLVLSYADTRSWSSSTLKLEPRFPYVEEAFSTWGWGRGGESKTDIGVFWNVPKSCESISISPFMILVKYGRSLRNFVSLRDSIKLGKKKCKLPCTQKIPKLTFISKLKIFRIITIEHDYAYILNLTCSLIPLIKKKTNSFLSILKPN